LAFKLLNELFSGLWIETADYDWKNYPVIRLDFSQIHQREKALSDALKDEMGRVIDPFSLSRPSYDTASD